MINCNMVNYVMYSDVMLFFEMLDFGLYSDVMINCNMLKHVMLIASRQSCVSVAQERRQSAFS